MAKARILFFIAGMVPTAEEIAEAEKIGLCVYRNGACYDSATSTEVCDYVAGAVPAIYDSFPRLEVKAAEVKSPVSIQVVKPTNVEKKPEENKVVWSSGN